MAEELTVARPYAEAAFDLARETGALDKWAQMLAFTAKVMEDPQMAAVVANPKFTDTQVEALFLGVCEGKLDDAGQNFVRVLQRNGRLPLLPAIRSLFDELKADQEGKVEARVTSAFPLTDAQLKELVAALEAKFKRKVQPIVVEDRELIGGVKVEVGDVVIDASVRAQLQKMAVALT
jgi:F-type H+-transporting ATPase subunit delta